MCYPRRMPEPGHGGGSGGPMQDCPQLCAAVVKVKLSGSKLLEFREFLGLGFSIGWVQKAEPRIFSIEDL